MLLIYAWEVPHFPAHLKTHEWKMTQFECFSFRKTIVNSTHVPHSTMLHRTVNSLKRIVRWNLMNSMKRAANGKSSCCVVLRLRCVPLLMQCTFSFSISKYELRRIAEITVLKNDDSDECACDCVCWCLCAVFSFEMCAMITSMWCIYAVCDCVVHLCIWLECMSSAHCNLTIFPWFSALQTLRMEIKTGLPT